MLIVYQYVEDDGENTEASKKRRRRRRRRRPKKYELNFTYDSMSFQIFFMVKLNIDLYRNNENDQDGKHFKHLELDSYLDN